MRKPRSAPVSSMAAPMARSRMVAVERSRFRSSTSDGQLLQADFHAAGIAGGGFRLHARRQFVQIVEEVIRHGSLVTFP